jgi:DNA-directed RNA polymerase subunit F
MYSFSKYYIYINNQKKFLTFTKHCSYDHSETFEFIDKVKTKELHSKLHNYTAHC